MLLMRPFENVRVRIHTRSQQYIQRQHSVALAFLHGPHDGLVRPALSLLLASADQ